MLPALIIVLRETLEASIIVSVIIAYLKKTGHQKHYKVVWLGVLAGITLSIILAVVFNVFLGGFEGQAEEIYEGVTMLIAAGLLTWMIVWMLKQRHNLKKNIENKTETLIKNDHPVELFFLVFVSVAREGIETVIFMNAAAIQSEDQYMLLGAILGLVIAIALSFLIYKGIQKLALRKFFTATSVLLILFAAGLVAHGIHEFQEAHIIPIFIEHLWDMNHILDEKGTIGSLLKGLFGYNGNPSLLEVISYLMYLVASVFTIKLINSHGNHSGKSS